MDIIAVIIAMLLTGMVGGIIAGLLGVGGGIVMVPVLEVLLGSIGVDPSIRMHIAVGTSLAIILPTSLSSARTHHQEKAVLTDVVRYWGPYIVIGTILGALIAGNVAAGAVAVGTSVVPVVCTSGSDEPPHAASRRHDEASRVIARVCTGAFSQRIGAEPTCRTDHFSDAGDSRIHHAGDMLSVGHGRHARRRTSGVYGPRCAGAPAITTAGPGCTTRRSPDPTSSDHGRPRSRRLRADQPGEPPVRRRLPGLSAVPESHPFDLPDGSSRGPAGALRRLFRPA